MRYTVGLLLGVTVGALCRYFDVPAPAPPTLLGALLVVAVTLGYWGIGFFLK